MKREEVLLLSAGREADLLIAEHVMGGLVNGDPEDWSPKKEIWFWKHPHDGILIGMPYHANHLGKEPAQYSHSWSKFKPSTDIYHAWMVVEKMRPTADEGEPDYWAILDGGDQWIVESRWAHHDGDIPNYTVSAATIELAICRAALYPYSEPPLSGPSGELLTT